MDEKTEELRKIFLSVSDETEVTEQQSAARGSLDEEPVEEAELIELIETMRERYDFSTDLDDTELAGVVREFYDGTSDTAIGRQLGDVSAGTVRRARLDLHLVTDGDLDAPFDLDQLRELQEAGVTTKDKARVLDVSRSTVRKYERALEAQQRRRLVGDRFREEFDRLLGDDELSKQLTASIRETGLQEATEDMETNVSF